MQGGTVLEKFDVLDLKKGKWAKLTDMISKRDELSVCVGPCGSIFAVGGFGGPQAEMECLMSAERYDFDQEKWFELPPMQEARRALAVVAMPDGIYAIGGYDG